MTSSPAITLRWYQEEALKAGWDYFFKRSGNIIICLPTGSGKSLVIAAFIKRALEEYPACRVLVATHVRELITQNQKALYSYAPELTHHVGTYCAGLNKKEPEAQILFGSVQSLYKKSHELGVRHLLFIDECHLLPRSGFGQYRTLIAGMKETFQHTKIIGTTATPYRLDSGLLTVGKDKIFDTIVYDADIVKLIDDGFLSDLVPHRSKHKYDTKDVGKSGGDFKKGELADAVEKQTKVTKAALDECIKGASDRKSWLLFFASIKQAEYAHEYLVAQGIKSETLFGTTPSLFRNQIIEDFKHQKIQALCNVGVLTTGFDAPNIDFLGVLRPTMSTGLHVQILGRGMRVAPGKENCLVYDFAGNLDRHGPINKVKPKEKRENREKGEAPTKVCPRCKGENALTARECVHCGTPFEAPPPKIEARPAQQDVICRKQPRQWCPVTSVGYAVHKKHGKPPSMVVAYYGGKYSLRLAREWVCIQHPGFAGTKALEWVTKRIDPSEFPPMTANVLTRMGLRKLLWEPIEILLDTNGEFERVVGYKWPERPVKKIYPPNYYEILDVPGNVTREELKSQYHMLAHKFHPDKHPDDEEAEARFKEISNAYQALDKRLEMRG